MPGVPPLEGEREQREQEREKREKRERELGRYFIPTYFIHFIHSTPNTWYKI